MTRPRKKLNLQCSFCPKRYTKREHLQRHERIHTGAKPFSCPVCGRCFSRQDVLNRHARVHTTTGTSPSSIPNAGLCVPSQTQTQGPTVEWPQISVSESTLPLYESQLDGTRQLPLSADLSSSLLWPDSEELLHNIMAIDPNVWQQPLALAPSTLALGEPVELMGSGSSYGPSPSETIADNGRQAIQSLSSLISDTFSRVTAPASLTGLTSRFLDGSLHMFFENIVPMFPVFHRATFVFRDCAPPLLLNAIALGALFLGSPDAIVKADVLWRLAHTAVATSWHTMIARRRPSDSCTGVELVQTVLLSQIYAALSKNRTFRTTSQVFHGLGIHWASHCGMYDSPDRITLPSPSDPPEKKQAAWRRWIAQETTIRTLLGLYIVDGVVSQFSGNPTFARHAANPLFLPSCEGAFHAPNPDTWVAQMNAHPTPRIRFCDLYHRLFQPPSLSPGQAVEWDISLFHHKVILEGIRCLVSESTRTNPPPVGLPSRSALLSVLRKLRHYILSSPHLGSVDRLTALLQWHTICLDSVVSTARGARRMCHLFNIKQSIFGGSARDEKRIDPGRWAQSPVARSSLLHASNVQVIAAQLPLGRAYDVNIPGAVFAAASTYTAFTLAGGAKVCLPGRVDWDAALVALGEEDEGGIRNGMEWGERGERGGGEREGMQETLDFIAGTFDASGLEGERYVVRDLSYDLTAIRTLLRGLSLQWGVATEMEEVVSAWIERCEL